MSTIPQLKTNKTESKTDLLTIDLNPSIKPMEFLYRANRATKYD